MKPIKFTPLSIALFTIAVLAGCSRQTVTAPPASVSDVHVLALQRATIPDLLEAPGTIRAAQTSDLAAQMMGNILEIRVHEGDPVRKGDVLVVIDDAQPRAALDRAIAAEAAAQQELTATTSELGLAESTLKRYQAMYDEKLVSPQVFDEIKTRQQAAIAQHDVAQAGEAQAKAAVAQARTALEYSRIRAPFDGVVTAKRADPGTLAAPGTPILTVEDTRHYRLEATINETDLRFARLGQKAPVSIDALDNQKSDGKIVEIVPAADPSTRSFLVKIELSSDPRLRSGLFGHAQFVRGERQSLLIPRTAVVDRGQLQGVFVLDENRVASLRYITLGNPSGAQVEVLAGLQPGEQLVATPGELDLNGKRIEAR